ncbi:porin [Actinobacillus succinogenes]|uniref:Porin Gram-negative type n=1 Tax=Actinobacillus succinogenes (strain ATCC 55618 / DSM 22257 / CCUG 43843 / 130Z) TaxID=339671 RepID=A6VNF6_ACTSZ|nr:porin [Actinobacillus succinogenes]ABR74503.1 porin Gram-negative type [Actinobacillus succinogenes 130Z]PHI41079.1 porin [Actinobacillus succinogenes]
MKKTLVALAVAAAAVASTANAAVVYEQDGAKVELSGSFRTFLGKTGEGRSDLVNDGSRIIVKASQDLGNGLSAFAGYQIRFTEDGNATNVNKGSDSDFDNPSTRELYAGLAHQDVGRLAFGRQQTTADDVLQDATYYRSGAYNILTTRSDKSVKFKSAEWNGFSFGADYLFGHSNTDVDRYVGEYVEYKNGYGVTAFYHYDFAENHGLEFAAGYTQDNYDDIAYSNDSVGKNKAWLLHGSYTYGPFYLALNYGQYKNEVSDAYTEVVTGRRTDAGTKGRYAMVDARYQFSEPSAVFAQWERLDVRSEATGNTEEIANRYQVGVDYKLHKNVITYAMYERVNTKYDNAETDKDNIYGVGLRVFF